MDSEEEGQIQEIKAEKIVKKQMMNDEDEES